MTRHNDLSCQTDFPASAPQIHSSVIPGAVLLPGWESEMIELGESLQLICGCLTPKYFETKLQIHKINDNLSLAPPRPKGLERTPPFPRPPLPF